MHTKNIKKMNTSAKEFLQKNLNKFESTTKLALAINKEYNLSINYHQLYYQETKLMKNKFGDPSNDAHQLVEYAQKQSDQGECLFDYKCNEMGELSHFIYSSRQMVDVPTFYFDTMILPIYFTNWIL